jgi:hypothetical protein
MAKSKEFLVQCDNNEADEARYCVFSVDAELLEKRRRALAIAREADDGLTSLTFSNGFSATYLDDNFPVTEDYAEEPEQCPFSKEVQAEFEAERVAEIPDGSRASVEENMAGFVSEVEEEDGRIVVSDIGVMCFVTTEDGAVVVRTWTVTWDVVHGAA